MVKNYHNISKKTKGEKKKMFNLEHNHTYTGKKYLTIMWHKPTQHTNFIVYRACYCLESHSHQSSSCC